jgi:hypothetical protein
LKKEMIWQSETRGLQSTKKKLLSTTSNRKKRKRTSSWAKFKKWRKRDTKGIRLGLRNGIRTKK